MGWLIGVPGVVYLLSQVLRNSVAVVERELEAGFAVGATAVGTLTGALFLAYAIAQVPLCVAIDRLGPRRALGLGAALMVAGAVSFALARAPWELVAARVLMGVGAAPIFAGIMSVVADAVPATRFSTWSGVVTGIGRSGVILAAAPLAALVAWLDWRGAFLVLAVLEFKMFRYPLAAIVVAACLGPAAEACTGISMSTTGGQHVHGRTIEWGHFNLNSKLVISPRNHSYTSALPMDKKGLTWRSKLGFVGISVSDDRYIGEGINEAGLTAGLFYFKAYGSLAPFDPANTADNIIDMDFVRWMLSQFSTVDEVKAALKSIKIVPVFIDRDGQPSPTAHWRVTDRSGKRIVIEIVDQGQIRIYDNKIGVLTNAPDFPWQVENLNNYVHLLPGTVAPRKWGEVELKPFGTGTAAAGLPGDFSPPSRFVRAAFLLHTTPPSKTADEAVSQVFHILNSFDIPLGTEFGKDERAEMPELPSATQWVAVSDQNNGRFFYKTMNDSAIKMVDLKRVNFGTPTELTRALDSGRFTFQILAP